MYLLIILISFFTIQPLFHVGFFPIHDDEQVGRLYEIDQDVRAGHIPPRLAQDLGFGYDYPLFNFYPPLVYYIAELFRLMGVSYIWSIKIMVGIGFILSAIFMYLFCREYFGKAGSLLASVAYLYAPYHSVDIYVRGAFPEAWSFVAIPLVFWAYTRFYHTQKFYWAIAAGVALASFVLAHNLIMMMSVLFIGIYLIFLWITTKQKKKFVIGVLVSGILALCLSAYFLLPAVMEKKFTMVDLLTTELADYNLHFVCVKQFFNSPWGYGGSLYNCDDGLSFEVGKVQLVLGVVAAVATLYTILKKKKYATVLVIFWGMFLFSLFIQTVYSKPIWDILQAFSYIQFPWRFLVLSAFTLSFLIASIELLPLKRTYRLWGIAVAIVLIIAVNQQFFVPSKYLSEVTDNSYISQSVLRWRTSIMAFEYTPKGIATKKSDIGNSVIDVRQDQIATAAYTVLSGDIDVDVLKNNPQTKQYKMTVHSPGTVSLNTYTFPGWVVFANGKQIQYSSNNKLKLITINLSPGMYNIEAKFTDTLYRRTGNILTFLALISVLIYTIFLVTKKKHIK